MKDKEWEKLEDLIIAILLAKTDIRNCSEGRCLHFQLDKRKVSLLESYLHKYNLYSQVVFDKETLEGYIKPSIMLEKNLKNWVKDNKVYVIDPLTLRVNAYYIWICLFARKTNKGVAISTNLDSHIIFTLANVFYRQFGVHLIHNTDIYIKPFGPIILHALLQNNRSIEEAVELSHLLPQKEKEKLKLIISEWEEEKSNYAY